MRVEVVHALPGAQHVAVVELDETANVGDAIARCGFVERFGLLLDDDHVGVWNRRVTLATPVREGDRIEIYRDLIADPKQARRQRAVENPVGVQPKRKLSRF